MPTFVLVGHCGPDTYLLKNAITRAVAGAKIVSADDSASLEAHARKGGILLINRTLDGAGFDTESGLELIAELAQSDAPPTMMLVSNYAEAQQEAIAAGAQPGFGKRDVNARETGARLREAAARVTTS